MKKHKSYIYHIGESRRNHRKAWTAVIVLLIALLFGGICAAGRFLKPDTTLQQSDGLVSVVSADKDGTQTVRTPYFTLLLPKNWKVQSLPNSSYQIYSWRGTTKEDESRSLDVYVDTIPVNFYVNRMLPIKWADNKLTTIDNVSDNCANFTNTTATTKPDHERAKWAGIDFWCDLANYSRDVVGTSSEEGINTITIGTHRFFFVYTDNNITADYSIFTRAIESFTLL